MLLDLVRSLPGPLLVVDGGRGIIEASCSAERLFGYAGHELRGVDARQLFPAGTEDGPVLARRKDGSVFRLEVRQGVFDPWNVQVLWLSERTDPRAESAPADENPLPFEHALDGADAGAYRLDEQSGRLWSDERHDALFGVPRGRSDHTYGPFMSRVHPDDRDRVFTLAEEAARIAAPLELEFRITCSDGSIRWIASRSRVRPEGNGGPAYRHGVVYDITERKVAEEQLRGAMKELERATQAKSELLASVSHEMRTPMHAVLGMTDILLDSELDEEQRDLAQRVRRAGASLLATLNDVLDLSKAEAGKIELFPGRVTLRPWLDEIICLFAHQAETKGLDLRCQVASGVPVAVEADANRLRQILVNLIGNALKFTHRGHVTLRANARREHAGVARVDFVVEDSGPGIASADLARLFEPYSQLDTGGLEIVGTGLGLAIARRLAEQMGGEIRVKSRLGQGSTFRVTVPLKPVESEAASEPPRRRPPASMPASVIPVDGSRPTTDRTSHVAHPRS